MKKGDFFVHSPSKFLFIFCFLKGTPFAKVVDDLFLRGPWEANFPLVCEKFQYVCQDTFSTSQRLITFGKVSSLHTSEPVTDINNP